MARSLPAALYVGAMIVLIVGVDVLFLRDRAGARLIANIAIVAAFGLFYLVFMRRR